MTSFFEACTDLLVTERNTNQDYVLHSRILTAGIRHSEEAGKMPLFTQEALLCRSLRALITQAQASREAFLIKGEQPSLGWPRSAKL